MCKDQSRFPAVNLADPRQDIHKDRKSRQDLNRYRIAKKLLPAKPRGMKVLELGGGAGEFSRVMKALGIKVTIVDLSDHNIERAAKMGFETHKIDLNYGLPVFKDAQFDGVVILEVIEHVVAAEFLLEEANRVLKDGGFIILSTPNFAFFLNRLGILCGGLSHDEGYHYRFFTVKTLANRLTEAGFSVQRTAHSMPAIGINFIYSKILKRKRLHIQVPNVLSPLFAQTLIVQARKE